MNIKLMFLLAGVVLIAGCATQGYVEVGTPIYYEPVYVGPPVWYYGPGPYYYHHRNYYYPPRHIAPPPPHRVVVPAPAPTPRVTPTPPPRGNNRPMVPPQQGRGNGGPQNRQQGPPQRP